MAITPIRRTLPVLAALTMLFVGNEAEAFNPRANVVQNPAADGKLRFVDGAPVDVRDVAWNHQPSGGADSAWRRLEAEVGWARASWERRGEVPSRILLSGVHVPDSVRTPGVALNWGRAFLSRHIDLLAPGASPGDFVLVADDLDAGIRSLGFQQMHGGIPVVGGQISLRFKHDRLIAIGSEAIPDITLRPGPTNFDRRAIEQAARNRIAGQVDGTLTGSRVLGDLQILREWTPTGPVDHRVIEIELEVEGPTTRWQVFVDVDRNTVLATRQTLMFATASSSLGVPTRYPQAGYSGFPATHAEFIVDGNPTVLDGAGFFSFPGPTAQVTAIASGPFFELNPAQGSQPTLDAVVSDGQVVAWTGFADEFEDAHLASFAHAEAVRRHVLVHAGNLPFMQEQVPVTVNIDDVCNAFSDGFSINFFAEGAGCANTGRLADVIYHEYAHSVHSQAIIPGVGSFDGGVSEGAGDYLSATITNDPGVGRGFFLSDEALRDIDPNGFEWSWPEDKGEVHSEGHIFSGAMWDLRQLLIEKHGYEEGRLRADHIWYQTLRRGTDMLSSYPEAMIANDDDGDLSNGTPDVCEIIDAYGRHGLYVSSTTGETEVQLDDLGDGYAVSLTLADEFPQCNLDAMPLLWWKLRGEPGEGDVAVMQNTGNGYVAFIPAMPDDEVLQYRVEIEYDFEGTEQLPGNYVDPFYEYYIGPTVPLYCTSFENGFPNDWSFQNPTSWQAGVPGGFTASGDPLAAHDGISFLGNDVVGPDGFYSPGTSTSAATPVIDTQGYEVIRLQYRRWLTVEDGYWDQAEIQAGGEVQWAAHESEDEDWATLHHHDHEWRFHDVDLSDAASDTVQVAFTLRSDGGLEFGGWSIDSLCIVGAGEQVEDPFCGNGIVEDGEECDDGNDIIGDGCDPDCTFSENEPPGTDDPPETDDPGGTGDETETDGDTSFGPGADYDLVGRGCGCAASDGTSGGASLLALMGLLATVRRRRRIARRS
jgi:MYXO-CTERM domain-containing protein